MQYTLGHNLKLHAQEAKCVRSNFLSSRVIRDWNNLANDTVPAKSIKVCKAKLRHEWMNHTELYNNTFHTDHPSSREINTLWVNIDGVQGMIQGMNLVLFNFNISVD